jgi:hypothetical protein
MSFFADLLAGGAAGFGKLMVDQADIEDRREAALALQREKQQAAMELQRQRAEDRAFQIQLANEGKASRSGGSGGGQDVVSMIMGADTPEKRQQVLGMVESLGGVNAARQVAEKVYGSPMTQERSYETIDALGDGSGGGVTSVRERAAYLAEKGAQELQRLYALTANKGDTKGHAQGEDQYMTNDLREAGLTQALKGGKPLAEASAYASRVSDPATYDKNKTNADRVDATVKGLEGKLDAAEMRRLLDITKAEAKTASEIENQIIAYEKLSNDPMASADKRKSYEAEIQRLKVKRDTAVSPAPVAPAKATITGGGRTATGTITRPRDAARAAGY